MRVLIVTHYFPPETGAPQARLSALAATWAADGDDVTVGTPLVSSATVSGTVLRMGKDKKILVFRYKPKKRVRKLTGHRQRFAEVRIDKIALS